jgi:hypothetical protein
MRTEPKLRLFAKMDIRVVDRIIKAGEEVRIGKISESTKKFMLICKDDDLHLWIDMDKYNDTVEDKLV